MVDYIVRIEEDDLTILREDSDSIVPMNITELKGILNEYEEKMRSKAPPIDHEMKLKLEMLKEEIERKEEEIRTKERFLMEKMEELKLREQGVIEDELGAREDERTLEWKVEKVKTGNVRLDELMYGGLPFGSNVMVYGPPFVGKEILVNNFVAEGLKKGVPAIYVLTERNPSEIREEMAFILSGFEQYERLGLVHYVDSYSISMGEETNDNHTIYIEDPGDIKGITAAVDKIAEDVIKEHRYYRLAFRSVSPITAYVDLNQAFRALQPFAGKRRRQKAVSMHIFEKGMHSDQEIDMFSSFMDGVIDFKVERLRTSLCVKGITDAQSNSYIEYTHSKQGLVLGSFSLGKAR